MRNNENLGLVAHVNKVLSGIESDIIVLAAGDDVSIESRVEIQVKELLSSRDIYLVHSDVTKIDINGKPLGIAAPPICTIRNSILDIAVANSIYIGATGAFKRDLIKLFGPIQMSNTYEDLTFGFRAALLGKLRYINHPLVYYRFQGGLSSGDALRTMRRHSARIKEIINRIHTLEQRLLDLQVVGAAHQTTLYKHISDVYEIEKGRLILYSKPRLYVSFLVSKKMWFYLALLVSEAYQFLRRRKIVHAIFGGQDSSINN